jgi:hypothetical protein
MLLLLRNCAGPSMAMAFFCNAALTDVPLMTLALVH